MCPDRQILSIYFDGELDSPWKEKLERHLEECSLCRDQLAAYRMTREKLAQDPSGLEQAMQRVWEKSNFTYKTRRRFWSSSVAIPVPVAAAAGLIMVLALAALITLRQPVRGIDQQLAAMETLTDIEVQNTQEMLPASMDMASVLQYLGNDNSGDMVIIKLPERKFRKTGEPRMLRAADYPRRSGSR